MFGVWTNALEDLHSQYVNAEPYEHVVIPEFLSEEFAELVFKELPDPDETWHVYDTPFEQKYLTSNQAKFPLHVKKLFEKINSNDFVEIIGKICGIDGMFSDPTMHAGGIHAYPRNGKIDIHLDYTIHPKTGKERRVSFMLYMNKNWKREYGGHLQLWKPDLSGYKEINSDLWNTAVIFKTSEQTYHGLPDKITCPIGMNRKVIGVYYLTEPRPETLANPRYNAEMFPKPGAAVDERLAELYRIRKTRRLVPDDVKDWPTWKTDCALI